LAGSFPGIANCQQHDANGKPLAACLLTVFAGGTTSPSLVYQDIGLTIAAPNPLVGDITGRIPLFFVADGIYHVRLTDQFGVMANGGFDLSQVPSIGASTSGGGGSAVDPTTIAATGDLKWRLEDATIIGWVRINGRTIGGSSSGASERANADTQALFIYIWTTYSQPSANVVCPVVGGIGASGLADFNANKQITLLDARDRGIFGLDTMGNAALGGFAGITFTQGSAILPGSAAGGTASTLVTANLPPYTPKGTNGAVTITAGGGNPLGIASGTGSQVAQSGSGSSPFFSAGTFVTISASVPSFTGAAATGQTSTPFPTVSPFLLGTVYWKL
jgi:hypothetical protein